MSAAGVQAAVEKISDDLFKIALAIFENDDISTNIKVGKNTLKDSALRYDLYVQQAASDDVVIQAFFNNYVVFIEWDRPAKYGKKPPIDALKGWAEKNGIDTDASTLWAISYAIWRDGHAGRPIFASIDAATDKEFTQRWGDELFSAITDKLDEYFND